MIMKTPSTQLGVRKSSETDAESAPRKSGSFARDTHSYTSAERHVVLDKSFDAPLADRPLSVEELHDVSMTFFRREVYWSFLIFVDRVESRLRGCDGVHQQIFADAQIAS